MVSVSAIFNRVARLPNAGVLGDWGNAPNKHRRQLYVRAHCLRKCVAAPRYTACKTVCGPSIHCLRVCITSFWRILLREAFLSRKQCSDDNRHKPASNVPVYTVANLQAVFRYIPSQTCKQCADYHRSPSLVGWHCPQSPRTSLFVRSHAPHGGAK